MRFSHETQALIWGLNDMNMYRILPIFAVCLLTTFTLCAQPPGRGMSMGGGRGMSMGGGRGGAMGGGRGGDPMEFIRRFDRNNNGMLDADEQSGPLKQMIPRLQKFESKIKSGQPISLKKMESAFEKMRADTGSSQSQTQSSSNNSNNSNNDQSLIPELLVQGFGSETPPTPLLGFGSTAEMMSVTVTEADEREADERLRRYDRNQNGYLDKEELTRFSGNPMDFDRNRDEKLSRSELAVRYARRREFKEDAKNDGKSRKDNSDRRREDKTEIPDVYNGRRSFRSSDEKALPDGLPGFFTDRDKNGDGQITLAEYASEFNDSIVAEFMESDLNNDGVIIPSEALRAVEQSDTSSEPDEKSTASSSRGSGSSKSKKSKSTDSDKPDEKFVKVAERIIKRYDKNKNGELTAAEWSTMLMSPAKADGNRDGKITVNEYASWMKSRERK